MRRVRTFAMALLGTGLIASSAFGQAPPPVAPVRPVTDDYFGTKVVDNYRYFENLQDPEVQQWMKAQADYTRATLDALPGRAALVDRITALIQSIPAGVAGLEIVGGRYYTLRNPADAQSPKLYVRDGVDGKDRLLVDPEKPSTDQHSHLTIDGYAPSPDGRYVAYGIARGGSEQTVLHIFDVQAGEDLPETADRAHGDPSWRPDNRSFFYARRQKLTGDMPATDRDKNSRVYLHVLGRSFDDDPPILGRGVSDGAIAMTPAEIARIVTSPESHYAVAFVKPGGAPQIRVYVAPLAAIRDGSTAWRAVAASYDDQYIGSSFDNGAATVAGLTGDALYWLSRKDAPQGRILKLDLTQADSRPEVVVEQGDRPISVVTASRDAIYWRVSDAGIYAVERLRLAKHATPEVVTLPYAANIAAVATDGTSSAAVVSATSWLRSPAYLSVGARTGAAVVTELRPAGFYDRADDFVAEEVKVKSWDGTLVPLSIVHQKSLELDGSHPALLWGYGAYGASDTPGYAAPLRAIIERGVVSADCHVRGGGEYGEAWHQAGFQTSKPNTWKDYIACAEYLIAHRYTSASHLIGHGGSAGGILIGRAIEERPDLFAAAVADVPLTDMLRFETTANGPGNIAEFGSTKTEAGFRALDAMSPYANVKDGVKYPAVLITTGINDPRVPAWIPAKFAARLQAASASGKPVLLRVDYDAGHGLDATRRQAIASLADYVSFALWQSGDPAFQPKQ
ncbi:MAG: prolyl oligopeptidase family serine peptidase [Gemmatimonadales bacterium]